MSELMSLFAPLWGDLVWQSSAILAAALVAVRFVVRQPARAHAVLILALVAALVAPAVGELGRRQGWGMLTPMAVEQETPGVATIATRLESATRVESSTGETAVADTATARTRALGAADSQSEQESQEQLAIDRANLRASRDIPNAEAVVASPVPAGVAVGQGDLASRRATGTDLLSTVVMALAALWLVASIAAIVRLLRGAVAGARMVKTAGHCDDVRVEAALAEARLRLDLRDLPVAVFQSSLVRCPMIWCWGRGPKLLLPIEAARTWSYERWLPILCHELAHWKRRDHVSALVAETVCCLLPWQPLAWVAKRRLEQASEEACDDWTVAAGHSPVDYAETLLGLVAQADPPLALAALRRRSGLASRIRHILSHAVGKPRLGRLWTAAALTVAITGVGITAVCQRGVARADDPTQSGAAEPAKTSEEAKELKSEGKSKPADKSKSLEATPDKTRVAKPAAMNTGTIYTYTPGGPLIPAIGDPNGTDEPETFTLTGTVLTADGQPIGGAELFWDAAFRSSENPNAWLPEQTIATTRSRDDGTYEIKAQYVRKKLARQSLVVRAAGYGIRSQSHMDPPRPLDIRLEPSVPIEGSIYSPDGEPVAGAKVTVSQISQGSDTGNRENYNGWHMGLHPREVNSGEQRAHWPAVATTDADGKFRFDDLTPRRATAELRVQAPDYPPVEVSVRHPDSLIDDTRATYRDNNFMLVLETPYTVLGRLLDEQTGEPIANTQVEVQPHIYNRPYKGERVLATSGEDGRCTLRVGSADYYDVIVSAPKGYPGLHRNLSSRQIAQMLGAGRTLRYEIKLRRGIQVKGRVVDATSGEGVARAHVHYKPEVGRTLGLNRMFAPAVTDDDGTFEITAVDGKGFLLVDAGNQAFYRLDVPGARVGHYLEGIYPHGFAEIDVPAEGQIDPYLISLKRGSPLVVRALAPDGTPVRQMRVGCAEQSYNGFNYGEMTDGRFRLDAAEPGRKYRVFLICDEAKAGGVFEVESRADGKPIDVTLQPWATIRGRYVYDSGTPAPEITNFTHFRIYSDREPEGNAIVNLPFYGNFAGHRPTRETTDAGGNFELDGIIPGAFMYLQLNNRFAGDKRYYEVGTLKSGEVKELGDIVIHPNR